MHYTRHTSPEICENIALLVVSCDNYADLWGPFFTLFNRFWPDCPFKVYLLTNEQQDSFNGVTTINVGRDISWSDNLITALSKIPEDNVFIFIEDLFLYEHVNTAQIVDLCGQFLQLNANFLRFSLLPKPDKPFSEQLGIVSPGTIYRIATVLSLWKKSVLIDLLRSGETAWDFEVNGSIRSDHYDGFYAVWQNKLAVINTVIKGKWQRCAVNLMKRLCVSIDLRSRRVMSLTETFIYRFVVLRHRLLYCLPAPSRRRIKKLLTGGRSIYRLNQ